MSQSAKVAALISTRVVSAREHDPVNGQAGGEPLSQPQCFCPVSIPSVALARMAWQLAQTRAFPHFPPDMIRPFSRATARALPFAYAATAEYFAIIDRITAGEKP